MFGGNLPEDYLEDTGTTYVQHWEPKDVVLVSYTYPLSKYDMS